MKKHIQVVSGKGIQPSSSYGFVGEHYKPCLYEKTKQSRLDIVKEAYTNQENKKILKNNIRKNNGINK